MGLFELDPELVSEIKRLHFQTRRLADQGVQGRYRSAFRGRGIEFEEVREYLPGDDVRSIDWKVSARSQQTYVKNYREERELTVMIAVDVSASTLTGTQKQLRESLIARIGASLTFIALTNNDKVVLVTYSDQVETYHPPRKARSSVWRILHEVLRPTERHRATDLNGLCTFLNTVLKRKAIVFLLSDFIDQGYELPLATLAKRHDLTSVIVRDPADSELPDAGLLHVRDPETGITRLLDSSSPALRAQYRQNSREARRQLLTLMQRYGIGTLELQTDQEFLPKLKKFFDSRSSSRSLGTL